MVRKILAVVAGVVVWIAGVTIAGVIMRLTWPAYVSVADAMTFTLPMLIVRLSIGAVATVAMGLVSGIIAPQSVLTKLTPGILMLLAFIPQHISLWPKFPLWYHLVFLLSLVPLTYAGATLSSLLVPRRALPTSDSPGGRDGRRSDPASLTSASAKPISSSRG